MKKIALITVNRTLNYGTMLQMYACTQLFLKYDFHTTIIDYYRQCDYRERDFSSILKYCKKRIRTEKAPRLKTRLVAVLKACRTYQDTKYFFNICNEFMRTNLNMSAPYDSYNELRNNPPSADIFCSGSDQIWNTDYNGKIDPAYFLEFVDDTEKKIAFASSIGKDSLSETEIDNFKERLKRYDAVSVRELAAEIMLRKLDLSVTTILDPTLIIEKETWMDMTAPRSIKDSYLLIYKLKSNDTIDCIAQAIAKEKKLKIVRITFMQLKPKKGEQLIVLPSIPEFLSLIANADYIVTNSFHGTCFSINFGKQFTAVPREQYNSRIMNILQQLQIENRMCSSFNDYASQFAPISYERVFGVLKEKRNESLQWLEKVLGD